MGNKNYTKYSENSNNNKPVVDTELEQTDLNAGGEVVQNDPVDNNNITPDVTEGENNIEPDVTPDVTEGDNNVDPDVTEGDNNVDPDVTEGDNNVDPSQETIESAIVVNCVKLNVREKPSRDSKILCVLDKDTELTVAIENSTEDFYKVYCSSNDVLFEGYCIKTFIAIK